MNTDKALKALAGHGTAQNRKVYVRHGADPDKVYGVSFANLNLLVKHIKRNHTLATELWQTGNYDARNLATKIADSHAFTITQAEEWVKQVDNSLHAGLLGGVLAQSPFALRLIHRWTKKKPEFICETGYSLLSSLVKEDSRTVPSAQASDFLKRIEQEINTRPNWTRYGMNWALIALGTYKEEVREEALAAAARIGQVEVDHGETNCKTPLAAPYIHKAAAALAAKRARQAERS